MTAVWVPHDVQNQIVDFRSVLLREDGVRRRAVHRVARSDGQQFYSWWERYGRVSEHNGWIPRDFWLEDWEKKAIVDFHLKDPLEGNRQLTFMKLEADVVAVSPSNVWRVLSQEGLLKKWNASAACWMASAGSSCTRICANR